ncbi:hypothetical protein CAP36_13715 [Chitinophagaceae bacterium IBVUCB2]|nr:hypothetical protein CAP36_13715 [Chitinophagaceae bacterium IBVUCB2]
MKNYLAYILSASILCASCSSNRELTADYYRQNEATLVSIKDRFKKIHRLHPFSFEVRDKNYAEVGIEIITDSIRYIYHFNPGENNLADTLKAYRFNVPEMLSLFADMKQMRCTWITNLDYYERGQEKFMVFLSLRHNKLGSKRKEKYFTVAFFDQPQFFDNKGRLLDKEKSRTIRKINGQIFYKINNRACFTLSGTFR